MNPDQITRQGDHSSPGDPEPHISVLEINKTNSVTKSLHLVRKKKTPS